MSGRAVNVVPHDTLVFRAVAGTAVPCQPWPQMFVVTRTLMYADAVEVRPLTLSGLAKGIGRNFVTMMWWRLCWTLRGLGFLNTPEGGTYGWSDLTPFFWRHQQVRRFRWVKRTVALYARLARFVRERASKSEALR